MPDIIAMSNGFLLLYEMLREFQHFQHHGPHATRAPKMTLDTLSGI